MFRYVLGGLMVIAMASVASAGHKPGHSPGGGGGSAATLGDLTCTADQIARFDGVSEAWECSASLTVNEAAVATAKSTADTAVSNAATAQSTANTATSNAADAQSRVTTLEGQNLDDRVINLETDVAGLQAASGSSTLGDLNCTTDQIAKFNDDSGAWECAFDEVGGGEVGGDSFVVVDSTGQIIRHTTIDDNLRSAFVAVDVQFLGETVTVVHELEQGEIILKTHIRYESSDCSDQPYIFARDGGVIIGGGSTSPSPPPPPPSPPQLSMLPNFKESAIIIDPFAAGGPNSDARLIFFLDYNQLIFIAPLSILDDAGNCITQNQGEQWAFPVTEVQLSDFRDDFHALFPPPYRILLR